MQRALSDFEALHLNLAHGSGFLSFIYLFLLTVRAVIWWMNSDILNFAVCWVLLQPCLWWMASYCRVGWLFSLFNLPWSSRYFDVANSALPLGFKLHIETLSLPEIKIIHFYINVYKITKRINSRYLNKHLPSFVNWLCNSFSSFHEGTWALWSHDQTRHYEIEMFVTAVRSSV